MHPDVILTNGKFTTQNREYPNPEAVAITDGMFSALGDAAEVVTPPWRRSPRRTKRAKAPRQRRHAFSMLSLLRSPQPHARRSDRLGSDLPSRTAKLVRPAAYQGGRLFCARKRKIFPVESLNNRESGARAPLCPAGPHR